MSPYPFRRKPRPWTVEGSHSPMPDPRWRRFGSLHEVPHDLLVVRRWEPQKDIHGRHQGWGWHYYYPHNPIRFS